MGLSFPSSPSAFPPFSSPSLHPLSPSPSPSPFIVFLSRWNNANAEPFNRRRRAQEQIESEIRRDRRFSSAHTIIPPSTSSSLSTPSLGLKSRGSPSSPSAPSIPGRFSKYSKPPPDRTNSNINHPAFKQVRPRKLPPPVSAPDGEEAIRVTEKGVTYKLKDAPFEFQYSYTETPKVKPVALREPPFLPFGPKETPRPWTGRAPLPPSKKKLPEFDSFNPPRGKKGVKPVQSPGPFLAGSGGPRYHAASREEILGEPLTKEEIGELIKGCLKTRRQLHMGRDGFTHNMLENIHAHWKRRRVCKIKCIGVCTVDLDNVCQQLEVKTGGKVIHRQGGLIFLFRGRNYNYKTRPRYPLMLWRPVSPVYPRLVKRVPDGLTLEEANDLRKRGRDIPPICKLGKNGVYNKLVKQVREAFEVCELVRLNCKGMNRSDFKKIGAKLQDLVPCVLLSFAFEHILVWRGRDWKSSLVTCSDAVSSMVDEVVTANMPMESSAEDAQSFSELKLDTCSDATSSMVDEVVNANMPMESSAESAEGAKSFSELKFDTCSDAISSMVDEVVNVNMSMESSTKSADGGQSFSAEDAKEGPSTKTDVEPKTEESKHLETKMLHLEGVRLLLDQAIENGIAASLSELEYPDADIVYQRSVEFAKTARPGPTFQVRIRKKESKGGDSKKHAMRESDEEGEVRNTLVPVISEKRGGDIKKGGSNRRKDKTDQLLEVMPSVFPHGSLRVDELAKLLS